MVWCAATISFLGDGVFFGSVPLLSASFTRDPHTISLVSAVSGVGWLSLGLISGVLVDRWRKTRVMWQVDLLRGLVVAAFAGLVFTEHGGMALIFAVSLLLGMTAPFFDNASSAVLPELVDTATLERANSWTQTSMLVNLNLIGPPLGAALFVLQPAVPLTLQAISFLMAALLVCSVDRGSVVPPPVASRSLRTELVDGCRYLVRHRLLRSLAVLLGVINGVTGAVLSLLVLYVLEVLVLPQAAYGWLVSTFAVGGLVGAVVAVRIRQRLGTFNAVMLSAGLFATGTLLLGLFPVLPAVIAGIAMSGAGASLWNIVTVSLRQRIVPRELLGRVTGVYRMAGWGAFPLGAVGAGAMASLFSVQTAYVLAAAVLVGAALILATPLRRELSALEAAEAEEPYSAVAEV